MSERRAVETGKAAGAALTPIDDLIVRYHRSDKIKVPQTRGLVRRSQDHRLSGLINMLETKGGRSARAISRAKIPLKAHATCVHRRPSGVGML